MTYAPITSAVTEDSNEIETRSRGRRALVVVVGLTLLITVAVVGVSSRSSQLRATSKDGIESTISAAIAQCGADAPPRLQVKFNNAKPPSDSCVLPKIIEGVWTHSGEVDRGTMKSVTYTMMPDKTLDMYLDSCGYGSKHSNQYDCVSRWVVNDPTQLSKATWTNGVPTAMIQTEVCADTMNGIAGDLAVPPLGSTTWQVSCQNGQKEEVEVLLAPAQAVVEGAWSRQKCVSVPGSASIPTDVTAAEGEPLAKINDIKWAMGQQFQKAFSVSAKGIPDAMVSTMTTQFLADVKYAKAGTVQQAINPLNGNVCHWVWKWRITGFVSNGIWAPPMELYSASLTALTSNADVVPKCLPGFAKDISYQTCDSEAHQIPQTTVTAQEDHIQKSVR